MSTVNIFLKSFADDPDNYQRIQESTSVSNLRLLELTIVKDDETTIACAGVPSCTWEITDENGDITNADKIRYISEEQELAQAFIDLEEATIECIQVSTSMFLELANPSDDSEPPVIPDPEPEVIITALHERVTIVTEDYFIENEDTIRQVSKCGLLGSIFIDPNTYFAAKATQLEEDLPYIDTMEQLPDMLVQLDAGDIISFMMPVTMMLAIKAETEATIEDELAEIEGEQAGFFIDFIEEVTT